MHHIHGLDRLSLSYWLNGNGQWGTRWHCTSGDALLCVATIVSTAFMFLMYLLYAFRNQQALGIVKESHFREHAVRLRNVFVVCGFIHVLNSIGSWFYPVYWVIVALTCVNCWQCIWLLVSKRDVLSIQRHVQGEQAIRQVENAMELIHKSNRSNIADTIAQLEKIFARPG